METHVETLDNGLKVLLRPIPDATAFSAWAGYRIGSRNERPGMTGSTHWVEHMLFKGGGALAKGEIDRVVSRLGGKSNAFTDTDFTAYFLTLPKGHLRLALHIKAEQMRHAAFEPEEVESERTVVVSEREGAENRPAFLLEEELWGTAFRIHPYHWLPIGYKQDLQALARDPLYAHYRRFYAPNNAILVVVGAFDPDEARRLIRERFGPMEPDRPPVPVALREPPQQGERRAVLRRPGTVDLLGVGYHVPEFTHPDVPAITMLTAILGGWRGFNPFASAGWEPRSNRLYRALVDRKLASHTSARFEPKIDPSLLVVDATVLAGVPVPKVESAVLRVLERIGARPPTKTEMARARRQVASWTGYQNDGVTFQGLMTTYMELIHRYDYAEELAGTAARVTPEDVQRVAREYLREDNRTVCHFLAQGASA